ncbi:MAG TPA: zinc ribbon domain-containing protein [Ktedonobacteraceae bacterium]|nr:zinc ribbon domain-containing protein [Ktedonobacteraceae bacterium]
MQCTTCGSEIPAGAAYCTTCGAVSPEKVSESEISPYDYARSSSSNSEIPPPPPPPTNYGSPIYGMPQKTTYQPPNPYDPYSAALPPHRRKVNIGLIISAVVLALLVAGAGIFVAVSTLAKNNPPVNVTASPAITAPSLTATSPAVTPTSTVNPVTIPYSPYKGMLVLNDPLLDNSQGYNWLVTSDSNGSCAFTSGAYHVTTQKGGYFYPCMADATNFDNFAYEIQMKIIKGDCGALLFRVDSADTSFYYFRLCQDGTFALYRYSNNQGSTMIASQPNSAINAGFNKSNLVAVVAQGSILDLYVNQQKVDSISDPTFSHGKIGVVADGFPTNHPTEVVYSNARVWKL